MKAKNMKINLPTHSPLCDDLSKTVNCVAKYRLFKKIVIVKIVIGDDDKNHY